MKSFNDFYPFYQILPCSPFPIVRHSPTFPYRAFLDVQFYHLPNNLCVITFFLQIANFSLIVLVCNFYETDILYSTMQCSMFKYNKFPCPFYTLSSFFHRMFTQHPLMPTVIPCSIYHELRNFSNNTGHFWYLQYHISSLHKIKKGSFKVVCYSYPLNAILQNALNTILQNLNLSEMSKPI